MGCSCNGGSTKTTIVYRVIYNDGTRSADFDRQADAQAENERRGNKGTVVTAHKPA